MPEPKTTVVVSKGGMVVKKKSGDVDVYVKDNDGTIKKEG